MKDVIKLTNAFKILAIRYLDCYRGLSPSCWRNILLSMFDSVLVGVFYYLTIYFVSDLRMSASSAGLVISVCGVGSVLGGYFGGVLSDKYSPSAVSALALFVQGVAYLALLKLRSLLPLAIDSFLMGVASYIFITSNHISVLQLCNKSSSQRVRALNLLSTSSNLGSGISGLLLGYLLVFGFRKIFLLTAVCSLMLAILAYWLSEGSCVTDQGNDTCIDNDETDEYDLFSLSAVLFAVIGIGMVVSQLGATYPIYIQAKFHEMGISAVSILFALNAFLVVVIANPVGEYCDSFDKLIMAGVGGLLICLGMYILTLSGLFWVAIFACVVFTFGEVIFFSMAQYICYHSGSMRNTGKNLGIFRSTYAVSKIAGPLLGGYIYQYYSGDMVWSLSLAVGLIAFSVIIVVAKMPTWMVYAKHYTL